MKHKHRGSRRRRRLRRAIIALVLFLSFSVGLIVPVLARPLPQGLPPQETAEDLVEFLNWLLTGAGALALGAALSFIAEKIPAFQRVPKNWKFPVVVAATIALSLIVQIVVTLVPPAVFAVAQPYWRTAVVALFALVSSQVTHARVIQP
jgi:hypothetical protein